MKEEEETEEENTNKDNKTGKGTRTEFPEGEVVQSSQCYVEGKLNRNCLKSHGIRIFRGQ